MGHQEIKLAVAGLTEDQIAALDGDWSNFSAAEQAAFRYARRLTHEPHRLHDDDIGRLRPHYTDLQILEMTMSIAANNSINRWKEAIGVPQEEEASRFLTRADRPVSTDRPLPLKSFLTPTSDKFQSQRSALAPVRSAGIESDLSRVAAARRPPLESREQVERALAACRARTPRLPLVDEDQSRKLLPEDWAPGPLPQWVRLLANFPRDGKSRIVSLRSADEKGDLQPLFKAQVSWIAARQDRAWYALGLAQQRLAALGWSDDQIYKLDGPGDDFTPADRVAFAFARKLTATPDLIADADVAELRQHHSDRDVVQMISYLTNRALFDRITEASGLRLER